MTDDPIRLRDDPARSAAMRADLHAFAAWAAPFDMAAGHARFEAVRAGGSGRTWTRNARWWGLAAIGLASLVAMATYAAWRPSDPVAPVASAVMTAGSASASARSHESGGVARAESSVQPPPSIGASAAIVPAPQLGSPSVGTNGVGDTSTIAAAIPLDAPASAGGVARLGPRGLAALPDRAGRVVPAQNPTARGAHLRDDSVPAGRPVSVSDLLGDREHEQLTYAYAELSHNPARTLALAEAGQRAFPASTHVEEREALAIQALVRLHRLPEARARAERFVSRYPRGAYTGMVRQTALR
jgi:hypothetical protein